MKTASETIFTREQLAEVIGRAWKDQGFRQTLLDQPAEALAGMGFHLPPGVSLQVVEETATTVTIVLPASADPVGHERPTAEAQIVARAHQDPAFRAALLADPAAALQQAFGMHLPATMTVQVLLETPATRYLVLPLDPTAATDERELSDLELMSVAGGGRTYRPGGNPSCVIVVGNSRDIQGTSVSRRAQRC